MIVKLNLDWNYKIIRKDKSEDKEKLLNLYHKIKDYTKTLITTDIDSMIWESPMDLMFDTDT